MGKKALLVILVIAAFVAFLWWYMKTKSKETEPVDEPTTGNPDLNPNLDIKYTQDELETLMNEYDASRHDEDFKTWVLSLTDQQAGILLNKNKRRR
jgi:multidrug efflux pump subunit AcrB